MKRFCWIAVYVLAYLSIPANALANDNQCVLVNDYSPRAYWFREVFNGVGGIADGDTERTGYLLTNPAACFRVTLADLQAFEPRILGYKDAIARFISGLPDNAEEWNEEKSLHLREKIKSLVGIEFASLEELVAWWGLNEDYLYWSDEVGRLLVDADARAAGTPITERYPEIEIDPEEYWFAKAAGRIIQMEEANSHTKGWIFADIDMSYRFRISNQVLNDRNAKEAGYIRALGELLYDLRWRLKEGRLRYKVDLETIVSRLHAITGLSFSNMDEWPQWGVQYGGSLRLSGDGERLEPAP